MGAQNPQRGAAPLSPQGSGMMITHTTRRWNVQKSLAYFRPGAVQRMGGSSLKKYIWSSLPGYLKIKGRDEFMHYDMVLGYLGGDDRKGRERYRDFILKGLSEEKESPLKEVKANAVLGSDSFIVWVKEHFISEAGFRPRAYSHLKAIREPVAIRKIAEAVAKEYGVKPEEIIKKKSKFREARRVLLAISHRLNLRKRNMREMGAELGGISGEQVSQAHKAMQEKLRKDRRLLRRIEKIISNL